jgi:hypothetical protein
MQGINRVDSWAQFVNLVQDARRNQSVPTVKRAPAVARPAGISRPMNNQAVAAPRRPAYSQALSPVTAEPKVNTTKTLGSFFDAYA